MLYLDDGSVGGDDSDDGDVGGCSVQHLEDEPLVHGLGAAVAAVGPATVSGEVTVDGLEKEEGSETRETFVWNRNRGN